MRLHSHLTGREPSVEVLMLPHGCWRAPRGYDEVGPRLDQSLFGRRQEHCCAARDSGVDFETRFSRLHSPGKKFSVCGVYFVL
jgi:hypothetical protein